MGQHLDVLPKTAPGEREQKQSLYITFIDLTKAFDVVSRDGLFKVLVRMSCPQTLMSVIQTLHTGMTGVVQSIPDC